jgi:hypothetical protein
MSAQAEHDDSKSAPWDPLFVHSRREAIFIFLVWLAGLLWAVPFCYWNGYVPHVDPANVKTIWGIPSWIFWGIAVPWVLADVVTIWFCFGFMKLDELQPELESEDVPETKPTAGETGAAS